MIYFLIFTSIAISGLFTKTLLALLLLDVFWRFPVLTAMINVRNYNFKFIVRLAPNCVNFTYIGSFFHTLVLLFFTDL